MKEGLYKKTLVFAVIVLFIGAGVVPVFVAEAQFAEYESSNKIISKKIDSMYNQPSTIYKQNNILISSDNSEDDMNPKITRKGDTLVVAYEKVEGGLLEQTIQVSYSEDKGKTWDAKFNFNSVNISGGSGVLQSPDIKYAPAADEFFLTMIDPLSYMNNHQLVWLPGNIVTAEDARWRGLVGGRRSAYEAAACSYVDQWFLGLCTADIQANTDWNHNFLTKTLHTAYLYHDKDTDEILWPHEFKPRWVTPGPYCTYYDAQYVLETAPSYKPEMATGTNRVYLVTEYYVETNNKSQIVYKATITDVDLLLGTRGGGPKDMDKYADIEVWPWQMYLSEGSDPDVSADGSNVCVVYTCNGDVKCSYSSDDGMSWNTSAISTDSALPSVFMVGHHIYCAYIQDGNIYKIESEDGGATWGTPVKLNDVDGTVAEECGSVDVIDVGAVWVDMRSGTKDIYFATLNQPPSLPTINGPTSGKAGIEYDYTILATDPDGDIVFYYIDWDDNKAEKWIGPFESGEEITEEHTWTSVGTYTIKVKARDIHDVESEWATQSVSIPKSKFYINRPFLEFLQNHPLIYQLFQRFLRL